MIKLTSHPGTSGLRSGRRRYIRVCIYIYIVCWWQITGSNNATQRYYYGSESKLPLSSVVPKHICRSSTQKERHSYLYIYIQACKYNEKCVVISETTNKNHHAEASARARPPPMLLYATKSLTSFVSRTLR